MMSKKIFLILFSVAVCMLFYQNCSTTSGLYQKHRAVTLKSKLDIQLVDAQGQAFLSWKFQPGSEVVVAIAPSKKSFCERRLVLNKEYESKWSALVSSLHSVRSSASVEHRGVFKIKVDEREIKVAEKDSKKLFALMEETKLNHSLKVSNCKKMRWGFKNFTVESLIETKDSSKYLLTVEINSLGGNAAEAIIKEEPVEVALNGKDSFCDYTYREYDQNWPMLSMMFAANELKSMQAIGGRGLASLNDERSDSVNHNLLVTIDGTQKISAPEHSELSASLNLFIANVKASRKVRKSCAYAAF